MNDTEVQAVIDMLPNRVKLGVAEAAALHAVVSPFRFEDVVKVLIDLCSTETWIDVPMLKASLEGAGTADRVWPAVSALVTAGAFREQLDPAAFPSMRAYRAARSVASQLRSGDERSNRRAFCRAYADGEDDLPELADPALGSAVWELPS